jgi:cell division protein FtsL
MRYLSFSFLVMLLLLTSSAYILFKINHQVISLQRELKQTNKNILTEKENLHVLKAEWSFLTRPSRISKLAASELALQKVQPAKQIIHGIPAKNSSDFKEKGGDNEKP